MENYNFEVPEALLRSNHNLVISQSAYWRLIQAEEARMYELLNEELFTLPEGD